MGVEKLLPCPVVTDTVRKFIIEAGKNLSAEEAGTFSVGLLCDILDELRLIRAAAANPLVTVEPPPAAPQHARKYQGL